MTAVSAGAVTEEVQAAVRMAPHTSPIARALQHGEMGLAVVSWCLGLSTTPTATSNPQASSFISLARLGWQGWFGLPFIFTAQC